jgi:hypothetical protein
MISQINTKIIPADDGKSFRIVVRQGQKQKIVGGFTSEDQAWRFLRAVPPRLLVDALDGTLKLTLFKAAEPQDHLQ